MDDLKKDANNIEKFAKNLESDFKNFGENDEKNIKKDGGDAADNSTSDGWTLRSVLDCFGVADFQALLALSDKKIYEIAIKNYPKEVQKACGSYTGVNSALANFRAKTVEKLMKKYSYNIDVVISDEIACGIAMSLSVGSIFAQARFTANAIQDDMEILEKSKKAEEK